MVGDNVRKHPEVFRMVVERGHNVGNHTFNHIQGLRFPTRHYLENVAKAAELIPGTLFRPPHGHMRLSQALRLRQKYKIVMWDVVTRDYNSSLPPERILENVKRYTRNGSIIVFHDSLKAEKNLRPVLPRAIEWLLAEGYSFHLI